MPKIGTRKLYYMLREPLSEMDIGRDKSSINKDRILLIVGNRKNLFYQAFVTDAYSKNKGYDLSETLPAPGSIKVLKMALTNRMYPGILIHHSNRGLQFCLNEYQYILQKNKILTSKTESYDSYANSVAERVNGILKEEFNTAGFNLNLKNMKFLIKDCIDKYNGIRHHIILAI